MVESRVGRSSTRAVWRQEHVVDVRDAAFSIRTYREQQDVRGLLVSAIGASRREAACEVGAGYGRMTVVLTEFFDRVEGFERESHFVEEASRLLPEIRSRRARSTTVQLDLCAAAG